MAAPESDTEFVGSHLKAKNGYGQNGYQGPASDTPDKHTTSGFLPAVTAPAESSDGQCRKVSAEQYPTTFGMRGPKASAKVESSNARRANVPRTGTHFQR